VFEASVLSCKSADLLCSTARVLCASLLLFSVNWRRIHCSAAGNVVRVLASLAGKHNKEHKGHNSETH
jgi:hypothetical protein